jgi:asparagine synthase (glutamine-hydrolysing)
LGVDLAVERMTPHFEDLLLKAISHAEEPLADNSMLAVFLLCEATRRHVKVALSGDGADEFLAGYATYRASRYAGLYRRLPAAIRRGIVSPLVDRWPASGRKYALADFARRFAAGAEAGPLRDHASWRRMLSDRQKDVLYTPEMATAVAGHDPLAAYVAAGEAVPDYATLLERRLQMDIAFHLPNDMLVKVDRMSMAHSLEVRVPLLDLELIKTALAIPPQYKLRGRCGKYVLKRVLERRLPRTITRRKKAGFVLPIERWLTGAARPLLHDYLLSSGLVNSGLLVRSEVEKLAGARDGQVRASAYELFALLVLSVWWSMWIERSIPVRCVRPAAVRPTRVFALDGGSGVEEAAA